MKTRAFTGITLTLFLTITLFTAIPIEGQQNLGDPVKIAVAGPQGWEQWDGIWVGAKLAQEKINLGPDGVEGTADDGIVVDGVNHLVELKAVDTHAVPSPEPEKGVAELLDALEWGADFVIGGFRTECVAPMREAFVDYAKNKEDTTGYAPIWFIAGASTDELVDCGSDPSVGLVCLSCVRCDYDRYKYMFRVTPMSSTMLVRQIAAFLKLFVLPRLVKIYGSPVKTYIVAEDLTWDEVLGAVLAGNGWPGCLSIVKFGVTVPNPYPTPPHGAAILGTDAEMVGYARTHALTPNFEPVFTDIDNTGAHLIIHVFSAGTGVDFITMWRERETKAVCVGINVVSQMQEFWDKVDEKCEYESFLASVGTRSPLVPGVTDVLWDEYKEKSGDILSDWYGTSMPSTYPIYTFWGAYDGLIALDETIEAHGSWPIPISELIPQIEQTERLGVLGNFKYTEYHDVYVPDDAVLDTWDSFYTRAHIPQWQNGRLEVVRPMDQSFSRKYRIPPWMYSLADFDLNLDGAVNMTDVNEATLAFGSYHGLPNWYIEADVSGDGKVDIDDVVAIAIKFGESVTPWPLE